MAKKKYRVTLNQELCKACGICIGLCPVGVYTAASDFRAVVSYPEKCTGCMTCDWHCPDYCMEVEAIEE